MAMIKGTKVRATRDIASGSVTIKQGSEGVITGVHDGYGHSFAVHFKSAYPAATSMSASRVFIPQTWSK